MTKQRKKLMALLLTTLIVFGASFGIFFSVQDANFLVSMDGYIVSKAEDDVHPYIKFSASNTAAWIYADMAPSAFHAAERTIEELELALSSQALLERISVTREKKNIWITVSMEGENEAELKQIVASFAQNLFEDVAAASKTSLPLESFHVLRPPEAQESFPYGSVLLKSLAVTLIYAGVFSWITFGIPAYRKRKLRYWIEETEQKEAQIPPKKTDIPLPKVSYGARMNQLLFRFPIQILCIFLCVALLTYAGFALFVPKKYIAKQLVSVSLLQDEIQTTEMVMESQDFLLSYHTHLSHPMLMRLFYRNLSHTVTDAYSEKELIEMCEITHQEPTGIFVVTFTAETKEDAEGLCSAFSAYAFSYLCESFGLGEFKLVGVAPELTEKSFAFQEVLSIVIGCTAAFAYLTIKDFRIRRKQKEALLAKSQT